MAARPGRDAWKGDLAWLIPAGPPCRGGSQRGCHASPHPWADGHVSDSPPASAVACPCAGCVDEMTGRRILREEDVADDVHPLAIEYVGRYALRFDWSDGHGTGIFPFEYLRRL
jgi:hypothetical protein